MTEPRPSEAAGQPAPHAANDAQHVEEVCPVHGPYVARVFSLPGLRGNRARSLCPACVAERHAEEEQRKRLSAAAECLRATCIPLRFRDGLKRFESHDPAMQHALRVCSGYASGFADALQSGAGLVLAGRMGTGKTLLACGIVEAVARMGHRARFIDAGELVSRVQRTYGGGAEEHRADVLTELAGPALLALDDVGAGVAREDAREILFGVISRRYNALRPTLVTTNCTLEELSNYIGQRGVDRLREGGEVVPFNWPSRRVAP